MKTNPIFTAIALATALFATGAVAQTDNQTPVPAAPAVPAMVPTPNEIIYIPRLPDPAELTNAAAAQGITVERIAQTGAQVTVVYRYADGQVHTVAYQLLPAAGGAPAVGSAPAIGSAPAMAMTAVPAAPTTVVYAAPAPAYYYYDPFYYPWPWYGPVSLRIGLGYGYYHFGGGGGFRHFGGGGGFRHFGGGGGFGHSGGGGSGFHR